MTGNKDPATRTDRFRGQQRGKHALDPLLMARICRDLARDLRAEDAMGWPPIGVTGPGGGAVITRAEAAVSMDQQAARWEIEAAGGPRNVVDREKIGF